MTKTTVKGIVDAVVPGLLTDDIVTAQVTKIRQKKTANTHEVVKNLL